MSDLIRYIFINIYDFTKINFRIFNSIQNVKNKQARPEMHGYNALDEVEYDDDGNLMTKNLLDKYDEEISGPAHQSFVIGQNISEEARKAQIRNKMIRADKILESVESASLKIASDFYTEDEMVSFKKPKKKVCLT
jgi:U4/U6.U5 tri-snRNP-associated protein 1